MGGVTRRKLLTVTSCFALSSGCSALRRDDSPQPPTPSATPEPVSVAPFYVTNALERPVNVRLRLYSNGDIFHEKTVSLAAYERDRGSTGNESSETTDSAAFRRIVREVPDETVYPALEAKRVDEPDWYGRTEPLADVPEDVTFNVTVWPPSIAVRLYDATEWEFPAVENDTGRQGTDPAAPANASGDETP